MVITIVIHAIAMTMRGDFLFLFEACSIDEVDIGIVEKQGCIMQQYDFYFINRSSKNSLLQIS